MRAEHDENARRRLRDRGVDVRILIFAPNYLPATRYGGPIRSSHGLARALVELGHAVSVFTTDVDGPGTLDVPLGRPVDLEGVSVTYFPVSAPRRLYYYPAMGRDFERQMPGFDAVHINGMFLWPGPKAARAASAAGVPYVVAPRGMLSPEMIGGRSTAVKRLWIAAQERRSLRNAAAIHVTSEEEADGVRRLGLALAPIAVIGNGVAPPERPPEPERIEEIWRGIPKGSRVAFLGRLDWTKGVGFAIGAVAAQDGAGIVIAGPDQIGLRKALEPKLRRGDGAAIGRFVGDLDGPDKWALLAGADVLLAPSLKESFGLSVAEALAVGTPVICSEGVGASTIVRRIDGRCVVARDGRAFADSLRSTLR